MDFEFDDGQRELHGTAAHVLTKEYPTARDAVGPDRDDRERALWKTLVALDWPGLAVDEADGGVGASMVELAIVLEQLGHAADPTPFLATTTQFAPTIVAFGSPDQRRRFLGPLVSDGRTGALAATWPLAAPAVSARRIAGGWELHGRTSTVLDGDRAEELAVPTLIDGARRVVVVAGEDVRTRRTPAFDPSLHLADVDLDGVRVTEDRLLEREADDLSPLADVVLTGLAITAVGACQRAFDMTIEYIGGREQFGVPIGSFQALKHKAVDMYVALERARALAYFAATTIAEGDGRRTLAASMAKAAAAEAHDLVFRHSIQMFGGVGFTWENDLHFYLRRAKAMSLLWGGAAEHRSRVGASMLDRSRDVQAVTR